MVKLKHGLRLFDRKPMAFHLYVTDRCNLDCHYCAEYDNDAPHPELADLKRWTRKAKELGCLHVGLQGGEPLLHPDIVEVVEHSKSLGLSVSLSTNGFLLTPDLAEDLGKAGLDALQVSIDRMRPTASRNVSTVLRHFPLGFSELAGRLHWGVASAPRPHVCVSVPRSRWYQLA